MKRLSPFLLSLLTLLTAVSAHAAASSQDLTGEMDALGANRDLIRKARAIDPENRVRVVQKRDVDRNLRFEIGASAALNAGGDPYTNTNLLGGLINFHLTPHWSLGVRYDNYANTLNSEGQRVRDNANAANVANSGAGARLPGLDYTKNSWLGLINWYPIYGKINFLDLGITQFDVYLIGGAGQISLQSGNAPLFTAGAGIGLWWSQHFATRLEARWQGYQDRPFDGIETYSRNINDTILGLSLGFLL